MFLTYIAGIPGTGAFADGFGGAARFFSPVGVVSNERWIYVSDRFNHRVRQLTCVPCPASYYCFSGAPVLYPLPSWVLLSIEFC